MTDLCFSATPDGLKMRLFMEETGLSCRTVPIGLSGDGPPALFESGAMLLYLARRTGRFLPADLDGRSEVLRWLFWQAGGLAPTVRLCAMLDRRLADRPFIAGDYSIADMAAYPWIARLAAQGRDLDAFPNARRWFEAIAARPGTVRAYRGVEANAL